MMIGARASARDYSDGIPWQPDPAPDPDGFDPSRKFLTPAERLFLESAVDRLIPPDDYPSASQAGVVDFLDDQLAGSFGRGDNFYIAGPFEDGEKSQGYQGPAPAVFYREAIAAVEALAAQRFAGRGFAELTGDEQDKLLSDLESGSADLGEVSASGFFDMLWQNTKEGYFADPVYGGNRNMAGWRMVGFPGARYDYRPFLARKGETLELEPVSIAGYALNFPPGG